MKKTSFPDSATQVASAKAKHTELARLIHDALSEIAVHISELGVRAVEIMDGVIELTIDANPGDVKRLIGTNGAHINAVRRIAKLWGDAHDYNVSIPNFDAPKDNHDRYEEFSPEPDWPRERLVGVLQRIVQSIAREPVGVEAIDSDSQTHIVFRYGRDANGRLMEALQSPLAIIGNAMGKKNGRTLAVHLRSKMLVRNATRR